jgi:hypothetical protein
MPDHTNDIAELLDNLDGGYWPEKHAALTALVAERDALRMGLDAANAGFPPDGSYTQSLVAERDNLKQRVAELVSKADELAAMKQERDALQQRVNDFDWGMEVARE